MAQERDKEHDNSVNSQAQQEWIWRRGSGQFQIQKTAQRSADMVMSPKTFLTEPLGQETQEPKPLHQLTLVPWH